MCVSIMGRDNTDPPNTFQKLYSCIFISRMRCLFCFNVCYCAFKGKWVSLTEKHLNRILNQLTIHFEKQIKCNKSNKKNENATNISVFMVVFLWFKDLSSNYFVHTLRIPNRDGTNHFVDRVRLMYLVIQPLRIRTVCCRCKFCYLQSLDCFLFNTFTAADDCSRFYRSLPPTTVVVLQIYRYVPVKVLKGGKCIVYQIFQRKKPFSVIYDMRIYLKL